MWAAITLVCAIALAVSDAMLKRSMEHGGGEFLMGWIRAAMTAAGFAMVLPFVSIPAIGKDMWVALAVGVPLELLATLLYVRALRVSPLSLTLPFLAFTPIFIIATSYLIAGERVSLGGAMGIGLIAVGSYTLNLHHIKEDGILGPLRAIRREPGSMMMLGVAVIYSVTATMIKVGITASSPGFYGMVYFVLFGLIYAPIGLRPPLRAPKTALWWCIGAGVLFFISFVAHVYAASMTEVAYMVAVKRTSLLVGVLIGWRFFGEPHPGERIMGAGMMLLGFIVIVTAA